MMQVCSTEYVYHALLNTGDEIIESILANGLRPFPPQRIQINRCPHQFRRPLDDESH